MEKGLHLTSCENNNQIYILANMDFDFDNFLLAANENPAEFAKLRENLIKAALTIFNDSGQGEQLQAEIDLCRLSLSQGQTAYLALAEQISFRVTALSECVAELIKLINE